MAITAFGSGTLTPTVAVESFVANVNEAAVFTYHVDLVNMVALDLVELRVYQMVLTAGASRVAYLATFQGVQPADALIAISVPISNELTDANALRFSLLQRLGTARAFPWKVLKHT